MVICLKHKSRHTEGACEDCLVEASEMVASNMGIPRFFICYDCGGKIPPESLWEHEC